MNQQANEKMQPGQLGMGETGFTLIELLIVMTIVAILAALVYPTFGEHVERSRRADAKAVLMQDAQLMERIFTENGTYTPGGNNPDIIDRSPLDGNTVYYNIALDGSTNATSFLIEAVPVTSGGGEGKLAIDQTGARWWDRNKNGGYDADENSWSEN